MAARAATAAVLVDARRGRSASSPSTSGRPSASRTLTVAMAAKKEYKVEIRDLQGRMHTLQVGVRAQGPFCPHEKKSGRPVAGHPFL